MVHHNRRGPLLTLALLACLGLAAPAMGLEMQATPDRGPSGALWVSEPVDTGVSIPCRGFGAIAKPYAPTLRSESAGSGMPWDQPTFAVDFGPWVDPDA